MSSGLLPLTMMSMKCQVLTCPSYQRIFPSIDVIVVVMGSAVRVFEMRDAARAVLFPSPALFFEPEAFVNFTVASVKLNVLPAGGAVLFFKIIWGNCSSPEKKLVSYIHYFMFAFHFHLFEILFLSSLDD